MACIEQGNSASGVAVMVVLSKVVTASRKRPLNLCCSIRCDRSVSLSGFLFSYSFGRSLTLTFRAMTKLAWLCRVKEWRSRPNIEGRGTSVTRYTGFEWRFSLFWFDERGGFFGNLRTSTSVSSSGSRSDITVK